MQNGSALNPWAYDDPTSARRKAFHLGEILGLTTTDSEELLAFLQNIYSKEIVTGLHNALTEEDTLLLTPYSLPTKESINNGEIFLPDSPHNIIKTGKFCDVPLIAGISSHEGMIMIPRVLSKPHLLPWVESNFQHVLSRTLCIRDNANFTRETTQKVKHFYFGNKGLSKETLSNYIEFNTDALFACGINYTVRQHIAFHRSPVFYYQFAFDGKLGLLKNLLGMKNLTGVCHGDEVGYLFDGSLQDVLLDPESPEVQTTRRLVRLWTNFAKTGNPTPGHDSMLDVIWSPATTSDLTYLNIDKELTMRCGLRNENVHFWEQTYKAALQEG
jgi:cholinesterase